MRMREVEPLAHGRGRKMESHRARRLRRELRAAPILRDHKILSIAAAELNAAEMDRRAAGIVEVHHVSPACLTKKAGRKWQE